MNPFMLSIIIALVAFSIFEVVTSIKRKGLWRYIFLMPLIFIVGVTTWVFIDINNNPKSHNLLPFELLIYLGYAIAAHIVLSIIKTVINKRDPSSGTT